YWFVFGTIRNRAPVEVAGEEVVFFAWLLAGFFMWIYCYQSIIQGSKSIYTRLRMLSKMNFPMSVIPNFVIFSNLYMHFIMLVLTICILHYMGFYATIYYAQIIYFFFFSTCFLFFFFFFFLYLLFIIIFCFFLFFLIVLFFIFFILIL